MKSKFDAPLSTSLSSTSSAPGASLLATSQAGQAKHRLYFVGRKKKRLLLQGSRENFFAERRYATAQQMSEIVVYLTGYLHPGFEVFADVLGRDLPEAGVRTVTEPNALSVLCLRLIASEVAHAVMEREIFCEPAERLVFTEFAPNESDVSWEQELSFYAMFWRTATLAEIESAEESVFVSLRSLPVEERRATFLTLVLAHGAVYTF